jgi:hypothetical protein
MENLAERTDDTRLVVAARGGRYTSRMATTGRQIAAARTLLGWTQARLSQESGVSPAGVQRAEHATGIPQMQTGSLFAMVQALEAAGIQLSMPTRAAARGCA